MKPEYRNNQQERKLIETVLLIVITTVLTIIVFVALSPGGYLSESMDMQRESDMQRILISIKAYLSEHRSIADLESEVGKIGECGVLKTYIGTEGVNLSRVLVDEYFKSIPSDPKRDCNQKDTCYLICRNSADGKISIRATKAETRVIEVSSNLKRSEYEG